MSSIISVFYKKSLTTRKTQANRLKREGSDIYYPHFLLASHFVVTAFGVSPEHFVAPSHLLLAEHFASASVVLFFVQPLKASIVKPMNAPTINLFIFLSPYIFLTVAV